MASESETTLRVALLCSSNLDLMGRRICEASKRRGLSIRPYFSSYGCWETDIVDAESALYTFEPDVAVLFIDAEDILPSLTPHGELPTMPDAENTGFAAWGRVERSIIGLLQRLPSRALVLCHNMAVPPVTSLGLLESNHGYSHTVAIETFNRSLRELARSESRLLVIDYQGLLAGYGWDNWHDRRLWHIGRVRLSRSSLDVLADTYARYLAALYTPRRKCLVLDLDNTLWGGIVGEDGVEGLHIGHTGVGFAYREFQMAIMALRSRGIILAVCSKNNPADALQVLEEHPEMVLRPDHFANLEINWVDKPTNLRRIAERLNIGLDSFVFWDDDPVERDSVRVRLPEVFVPEVPADPSDYADFLLRLECFDVVGLTDEDRQRGTLYLQQVQRESFLEQAPPESIEEYYESLKMQVIIEHATPHMISRVAQLTQRTNQFNLTTRRYSSSDIHAMCEDPTWRVYGLRLQDRFGDMGLVGAAAIHVDSQRWDLDTFLISCRALGRRVEDVFMACLTHAAAMDGALLRGTYTPTKRNGPIKDFLERHRLLIDGGAGNANGYVFEVNETAIQMPPWLSLEFVEAKDR